MAPLKQLCNKSISKHGQGQGMRTRETKQKGRRFWYQNMGTNILDLCAHDLPSVFAGVSEGAQLWVSLTYGLAIEELQLQVPLLYPPSTPMPLGSLHAPCSMPDI